MTDRGPYIQTYSGGRAYLLDPRPEDIRLIDIACGLAHTCRFGGQVEHHYCPTLEQQILTADLRWVAAGHLKAGDGLIGFDEEPVDLGSAGKRRRRFRPGHVVVATPVRRHVYRLEMSDGSTVRSSAEHPWLVATKQSRNQVWKTTESIVADLAAGRARYMHKFVEVWDAPRDDYGTGWLAGIADGEGCLTVANRGGVQLGIAQKQGAVLNQIEHALRCHHFDFMTASTGGTRDVFCAQLRGGWREMMRFLGQVRPLRLLANFSAAFAAGQFAKQLDGIGAPLQIVRTYDEGMQWCAGLETSTRTYLCEGYGAHNSVAQHCVLVSDLVQDETEHRLDKLVGLLHDASEAYLGDVVTPLKSLLPEFKAIEYKWHKAIGQAFGLGDLVAHPSDAVKKADVQALHLEAHTRLLGGPHQWHVAPSLEMELEEYDLDMPLAMYTKILAPEQARAHFLDRFRVLNGARLDR